MIDTSKAALKKSDSFHQPTGLKFKDENIVQRYIGA
jgi:hypothetical protein